VPKQRGCCLAASPQTLLAEPHRVIQQLYQKKSEGTVHAFKRRSLLRYPKTPKQPQPYTIAKELTAPLIWRASPFSWIITNTNQIHESKIRSLTELRPGFLFLFPLSWWMVVRLADRTNKGGQVQAAKTMTAWRRSLRSHLDFRRRRVGQSLVCLMYSTYPTLPYPTLPYQPLATGSHRPSGLRLSSCRT
jgi:hypothetical protein